MTAKEDLHRGVLVEIVDYDFRERVALQLDDNARVLIRLVANRGDISQDLVVHERRDSLDERGAVHVVGNFRDDDLFAMALEFLDARLAPHFHAATPGLDVLPDAGDAADRATGWKVRPFHVFHQSFDRDVGVIDLRANAVDHFTEIVRRDVRRHANGDAGAAVDEEVRESGGENRWLRPRLVIVRHEIDRLLVHVGHERGAEMGHARLGVTHRGRRIAFDRAKVALAVNERFAHRPRLRHVDKRRINHRLAMRVIVTARVAANLGAFSMLPVGEERKVMHRVEDAALRRLQSIAGIGQGARDDDRHRVIEERSRNLFGDVDGFYFFVGVIHESGRDRFVRRGESQKTLLPFPRKDVCLPDRDRPETRTPRCPYS